MTDSDPQSQFRVKRVFITSARRSGSTWLSVLLAMHARVVVVQQSSFFYYVDQFAPYFSPGAPFARQVLNTATGDGSQGGLNRKPIGDIVTAESMFRFLRPLAEWIYAELAASRENTLVVINHQPENVRSWKPILQMFPDAYFINMVRDPRSVFSSFVEAAGTWSNNTVFTCDPIQFAEEWNNDVENARALACATDRYHEISYERLNKNSTDELGKVHEFLGLPSSVEMCHSAFDACTLSKLQESGLGPDNFFRKGEVDGWRWELSRADISVIEYLCSDLMNKFHYEHSSVGGERVPFSFHIRTLRNRLKGALLRIAHRYLS